MTTNKRNNQAKITTPSGKIINIEDDKLVGLEKRIKQLENDVLDLRRILMSK